MTFDKTKKTSLNPLLKGIITHTRIPTREKVRHVKVHFRARVVPWVTSRRTRPQTRSRHRRGSRAPARALARGLVRSPTVRARRRTARSIARRAPRPCALERAENGLRSDILARGARARGRGADVAANARRRVSETRSVEEFSRRRRVDRASSRDACAREARRGSSPRIGGTPS